MLVKLRYQSSCWLTILFLGFALVGAIRGYRNNEVEEDCIWEGRGFPRDGPPSVMNARAECSTGKLVWHYPYGGLRVAFHPRDIKGAFRLCFTSKHSGINIFSEGFNNLTLLREAGDKATKKRTCVPSVRGHTVLYIEAPSKDSKIMKINYSFIALKKRGHRRPKGCKPCRYSRLIKMLCSSDFVVTGYVDSSYAVADTRETQADFIAKQLIQQKQQIFVRPNAEASYYKASIRIPSGCAWKKSKRRPLLVTGDVVPGKGAVMTCHVWDEAWVNLKKEYFKHLCGKFK